MKRKIFSKLLMVALVIAAVGSFVSCKDYDDDINNLQKQIDAKAALSELTALQSTLDSKIAAAQSAAAAAQATADAAATKTALADLKSALETAIADAKKAGTDAGTQAGQAITAANKAQETADAAAQAAKDADAAAKAALEAALKTIEETYETKAAAQEKADAAKEAIEAVKAIAEAAYTKAAAEELQSEVDELKSDLESLQTSLEASIDEKIAEKIKEVNNAVASVDAIWKAVTSIELLPSTYTTPGFTDVVKLLTGTEVANKFGSDAAPAGNVVRTYGAATEGEIQPVDYTAGKEIDFDNRIIIRVNPANAEVKKEDIVLINSKGESLEDFVEITKVEDYKQLITRANYATGLKVISIVRKDGVTDDQLAEATSGKKIKASDRPKTEAGTAAYAVGIKNGENDRMLFTTFDLEVTYGDYTPLAGLNFLVKGDADGQVWQQIANLKNRWDNGEKKLVGEDETKESPVAGKWYAEIDGINVTKDNKGMDRVYVDSLSTDGKGKNANYPIGDSRTGGAYVVVDEDSRSFTVNLNDLATYANNWKVQYYYVVLDKYAAVESAPSEYQSWSKYTYTGLNTITPATDPLKVTIEDEAAIGDIIGFRVIAVNYDGSLVDLDGRSFYVKVGDVKPVDSSKTIPVAFKAVQNDPTAATAAGDPAVADWTEPEVVLADAKKKDWNKEFNSNLAEFKLSDFNANYDLSKFSGSVSVAYSSTGTAVANVAGKTTVTINYWLLKSDALSAGAVQLATNAGEVKYVLTSANYAGSWVDTATKTEANQISVTDPDHHDNEVAKLGLTISKIMPSAPDFTWVTGREPVSNVLSIYPEPLAAVGGAVDYLTTSAAPAAEFNAQQYGIMAPGLTPAQQANFVLSIKKPNSATDTKNQGTIATANFTGIAIKDIVPTYPDNTTAATIYADKVFKFNTNYPATCTYNYAGISIDKVATTASVDYKASVGTPQLTAVKFVDRLDPSIQSYGWNNYAYYVGNAANATPGATAGQRVNKTNNKFFLVWSGVTTTKASVVVTATTLAKFGNAVDYTGGVGILSNATWPDIKDAVANAPTANVFWTLLHSSNSANLPIGNDMLTQSVVPASVPTNAYAQYDFGGGKKFRVEIVYNNQVYYTGDLTAAGVLTLAQNGLVLPPTANLAATMNIYASNRFGLSLDATWAGLAAADKQTKIASLDVTIFMNETSIEY